MANAILNKRLFSVKEYHRLAEVGILTAEDRVELINGEIITMNPIKSKHASINDHLFEWLVTDLVGKAIIRSQNPIHINDYSEPEPDLAIVKFQTHRYKSAHPVPKEIFWVIEVADSTLQKDRTIKRKMYEQAGIPEYWIINIQEEQVEVYRNLSKGKYHEHSIFKPGEEVRFEFLNFELTVEDVF